MSQEQPPRFSSESQARIGEVIDHSYELLSLLGEGGMAAVYLAERIVLGGHVAVKILHRHVCQDEELKKRFQNEAQAASRLDHPGIIKVLDFGTTNDESPYLAMEYCEGQDLEQVILRDGPMAPEAALKLGQQIAEALGAAHAAGIVHRDVKPSNCLLQTAPDGSYIVKVLDFGIAKLFEDSNTSATRTGTMMGTPAYMPPEQSRGTTDIDGRVDIYALGALIFYLLCGREVYIGDNAYDVLIAANTQPVPLTSDHAPEGSAISPELDAFIQCTLERDRSLRFRDMPAMLEALEALLSGEPSPSLSPSERPNLRPPHPDDPLAHLPAALPTIVDGPAATPAPSPAAAPATAPAQTPRTRTPRILAVTGSVAVLVGVGALLAGGAQELGVGFSEPENLQSGVDDTPASNTEVAAADRGSAKTPAKENKPATPRCPSGMIWIADGSFKMGCDPAGDSACYANEAPVRSVEVDGFCIDRHEVTVAAYAACVLAGQCTTAGAGQGCHGDDQGRADHPINCVDWAQAEAFCSQRNARLPNESEWEFAARGPDQRRFPWGSAHPSCTHAQMKDSRGSGCGHKTTDLSTARTQGGSPEGVLALAGNVWEWQHDAYGPEAKQRVLKGGGYGSSDRDLRASRRIGLAPTTQNNEIGFRCVADAQRP